MFDLSSLILIFFQTISHIDVVRAKVVVLNVKYNFAVDNIYLRSYKGLDFCRVENLKS